MRLILTLTASLLAGTAMAQTGTLGAIGNSGGGSADGSSAGVLGGDAGTGVLATEPVADPNDGAPGLPGPGLPEAVGLAAPDADAGLGGIGAATGPITGITELPIRSGDPDLDIGLDAGLDVGLEVGVDGGLEETASVPVPRALGDDDPDAQVMGGEPTIVEADGPVVVVPGDEDEPAAAEDDPANRLTEGVGGDVQPKTIAVGAGPEGATQ